uniref:Uncharacterized protein n=1 Tax=viral metagenome TaxID=1070528 RepID=A0A6M3L3N3_9ZZZZ
MKNIIFCFLFLSIFIYSSTHASDKWTITNTVLEISSQTLRFIDFKQTLQIAENPDKYSERNPLLGEHPSKEKVYLYFISGAIGHFMISYFLPEPYRTAFQASNIVLTLPVIAGNFQIGLGVRF